MSSELETTKEDFSTMITDSGDAVTLQPVSHVILSEIKVNLENKFRKEGKPIDPPTYESKLADGRIEVNEYDEESLEYPIEFALEEAENDPQKAREIVKEKTATAVALWTVHQEAKIELATLVNTRQRNYMIKNGVKDWNGGRDVPAEWVAELKELDFPVPDDQKELELYYIMRGLLKTPRDQIGAAKWIMILTASGVDDELVQGALEFFRLQVDGGNTATGNSSTQRREVLEDEPQGSGS